jgi:V8-like Glu-specific endopeptidase
MPQTSKQSSAGPHRSVSNRLAPTLSAIPSHPFGADFRRSPLVSGMEAFEGLQPSEDILVANGAKEPSTSIGALSFPQQRESLLAPSPGDERRPVPDTTLYPFRAVAWLRIWVANFQPFIATGWFIGPRAVATAGHAVFVRSPNPAVGNRWVDRIDVVPGMNDGQTPPYGGATSTRFNSVDGWTKQGKREFDYGVIFLDEALGDTVGKFCSKSGAVL